MLIVTVAILVAVPCVLWCVRWMMDKTIKEAFIIQEREVGDKIKRILKTSHRDHGRLVQLPANPEVVYANVDMDKDFDSRPWKRQDLSK